MKLEVVLFIVFICFVVSANADIPFDLESGKSISFDSITNSQQSSRFEFSGFQGRPGMVYRDDMSSSEVPPDTDHTVLYPAKNTTSLYLEAGLALMGRISNEVNEIDQFGYDVEDVYESGSVFLRMGAGHTFEHFGVFCYGDFTKFFPVFFFYQRNPYSPALLRFNTHLVGYGLETRLFGVLRFRAGYGQYEGNIEVGSENTSSPKSWSTDIDTGSGFHWSAGFIVAVVKNIMLSFEVTHHSYDIIAEETQTPAVVTDIHLSNWDWGMSLVTNMAAFHWDD